MVIYPITIVLMSIFVGAVFPLKPTDRHAVVSARRAALWQTALFIAAILCLALVTSK